MKVQKNDSLIYFIIIVISIILGLLLLKIMPELPVISDSLDYHMIAEGILTKHTFITISNEFIIYPPLYPIFLSIIYKLADVGLFSTVYFIQFLLVGGIAIFVFLILRKFSKVPLWIALLASLMTLLWPYFILYSQLISSEILYSFLLALFFLLFLSINENTKPGYIICTGIIIGLAILTRPVALLLLPFIFISLLIIKRMPTFFGEFSVPWKKYLLMFLVAMAVLIPWELYIKAKYNRFIPISSNLSFVFNKANKTFSYLPSEEALSENKSWIDVLKIKARNVYLFWDPGASGYHLDILKQKHTSAGYAVVFYKIVFFVILGFAGVGAFLLRKNKLVIFSIIIIAYFWALHTVLFPYPRYTLPIMPYVIIVALVSFSYGITIFKTKRSRRLAGEERGVSN